MKVQMQQEIANWMESEEELELDETKCVIWSIWAGSAGTWCPYMLINCVYQTYLSNKVQLNTFLSVYSSTATLIDTQILEVRVSLIV